MFKKSLYYILFIFLIIIILPLLITRGFFFFTGEDEGPLILKVYDTNKEKIVKMELETYLKGVVAAEMPAIYNLEALKAQAVAARTYALKQMPLYGGPGCSQNPEADISTDFRYSQAWISREEMKEKWGFLPFFYFWNRISRVVEETRGEVITYKGELIDAVYHSNAGGVTEDAYYVWGNKTPYLKSVKSPYDQESNKNYRYIFKIPISVFDEKLSTNILEFISSGKSENADNDDQKMLTDIKNNEEVFKVLNRSESGRVLAIKIAGKEFTGQQVRKKLSLPSNKFNFIIKEKFIETRVIGNGHGVGMSQAGANGLAKHGYTYSEIIKHYYSGVKIENLKELNK